MPKYEIIVRETRVLKYTVDAPTETIAIDRVISDSPYAGSHHSTQRLSREVYSVPLPEPVKVPVSVPEGLEPHPSVENYTAPVEPTVAPKATKRGKKR